MKRTLICPSRSDFPEDIWPIIEKSDVYDSSCSKEARVYFIDKGCGYYLKSSKSGTLSSEAALDEYFHSLGLGPRVISYIKKDNTDWLLTERVAGEDGTEQKYLREPKRLARFLGEKLRMLHEIDFGGCPNQNRLSEYIALASENAGRGIFDNTFSTIPNLDKSTAERMLLDLKGALCADTLIHGDYCLPNIMLDDWSLSGFIDLGFAGVADKHIDLFWGAFTLNFNLGTDEYRNCFFEAYGKDKIDPDLIRLIGIIECFA